MSTNFPTFEQFFSSVYGYQPHKWQSRLAQEVIAQGHVHSAISAPTGLGKTSVPSVIVYALALQIHNEHKRTFPQRIIMAVERQVIVDGISDSVTTLAKALNGDGAVKTLEPVINALKTLQSSISYNEANDVISLSTFHGNKKDPGVFRNICGVEIIATTVTQITTRLLGRSSSVSSRVAPMHAGIIAYDCAIIIDEPQLALHQVSVIKRLLDNGAHDVLGVPVSRVCIMGAKVGNNTDDSVFFFDMNKDADVDSYAHKLISAKKPVSVVATKESLPNECLALVKQEFDTRAKSKKLSVKEKNGNIVCIVNDVATAVSVAKKVESLAVKNGFALHVITGETRAIERPSVEEMKADKHVFVTTQTVEAGVDFSASFVISQLAPLPALIQRFGRLNRYAEYAHARGVVLLDGADNKGSDVTHAIYGDNCVVPVADFLNTFVTSGKTCDFSSAKQPQLYVDIANNANMSTDDLHPVSPTAPYFNEEVVSEYLSRTLDANADIKNFVYGMESIEDRKCSVVYRDSINVDNVSIFPSEIISMKVSDVRKILDGNKSAYNGLNVVVKTGDKWKKVTKRKDIAPGRMYVLSAHMGGFDSRFGVIPASKSQVDDVSLFIALQDNEGAKNKSVPLSENSLNYALSHCGVSDSKTKAQEIMAKVNLYLAGDATEKDKRNYVISLIAKTFPELNKKDISCSVVFDDSTSLTSAYLKFVSAKLAKAQDGINAKPLTLAAHMTQVGKLAKEFATIAGLKDDETVSCQEAGLWHDMGKVSQSFQLKLGAKPGEILAKSTGRIPLLSKFSRVNNVAAQSGTKALESNHAFLGAQLYNAIVSTDNASLVHWLIASHHGDTRGAGSEFSEYKNFTYLLRKKLEERYGVFALVYMETLVRSADWLASAYPDTEIAVDDNIVAFIDKAKELADSNDVNCDSLLGYSVSNDREHHFSVEALRSSYTPAWYASVGLAKALENSGAKDVVMWWDEATVAHFAFNGKDVAVEDVLNYSLSHYARSFSVANDAIAHNNSLWSEGKETEKFGLLAINHKAVINSAHSVNTVFDYLFTHDKERGNIFSSVISPWVGDADGAKKFVLPFPASNGNVIIDSSEFADVDLWLDSTWSELKPSDALNMYGENTSGLPNLALLALYGAMHYTPVTASGLGECARDRKLALPDFPVSPDVISIANDAVHGRFLIAKNNDEKAVKFLPGQVVNI